MLEDVIKTKRIGKKSVSILLYSVDKEDRYSCEGGHDHFYEIRISENDEADTFETYAENYIKKQAIKLFNKACKETQAELDKVGVFDSVTGKTFLFANQKDKKRFFNTWDKLVIDVLDREDEIGI